VQFRRETLQIPTYTFSGAETVAPLFKSTDTGGIYPYTAVDRDSMSSKPVPVTYEALVLENEYLRVTLLPELGGRIWSAYDKVAGREIFYCASVIKPSRYNQRGAWPVGNLELYGPFDAHMLTWPGEPWPWAVTSNRDGSATVTLSHIDHFFRDKISLKVTLRPGRSFIETTVRLHNGNLLPNRYLLWTNAGVAAGDETRFIYPMTRTIGHNSGEIGTWPVIGGVDLSWQKNNKNMLGVFGLDIYDNFISAYDFKKDYGTVCYTDRMLARGIKTWTWGTGAAALRHMASYTDQDGPYVEVQSGRFVWDGNYEFIDPGRTDGWTEYWYGAGKLGGLTTASRDVAAALEISSQRLDSARLSLVATGNFHAATVQLLADGQSIWEVKQSLRAGVANHLSVPVSPDAQKKELNLKIQSQDGRVLLDYYQYPNGAHPGALFALDSIPRNFGPPETLSVEEIFQKGLGFEKFGRLENAAAAYNAALARDDHYAPAHIRLGLLALDRSEAEAARQHFEAALARDPAAGESHYFLAVLYVEQGNIVEARRHLLRLLPSSPYFDRREYAIGLLDLQANDFEEAEQRFQSAADQNSSDPSVLQAYSYVLRKLKREQVARAKLDLLLALDSTNAFAFAEKLFLAQSPEAETLLDRACARHSQGYLELATQYFRLSGWREAAAVLDRGITLARDSGGVPHPLLYYYRAYAADRLSQPPALRKALDSARLSNLNIEIFPFRRETIAVLQRILEIEPNDANASALLGDILYSRNRRLEALQHWRTALAADVKHFLAHRDLGMALLEAGHTDEALGYLTRASELRPDQWSTMRLIAGLNARRGNAAAARQVLERALQQRPGNDVILENLASVEAQAENYDRALSLLAGHTFEPRHQSYSLMQLYQGIRLMLALRSLRQGNRERTLNEIHLAQQPPANLGADDFAALQKPRLLVFEALARGRAGDREGAMRAWQAAAKSSDDEIEGEGLFRAIALHQTGMKEQAESWMRNFIAVNEQRKSDSSLDLRVQAYYLQGIYDVFRGQKEQARLDFGRALELDQSYLFARQALAWLEAGEFEIPRVSPG
jgi:tetratricopeptide (TPR) repeat protein